MSQLSGRPLLRLTCRAVRKRQIHSSSSNRKIYPGHRGITREPRRNILVRWSRLLTEILVFVSLKDVLYEFGWSSLITDENFLTEEFGDPFDESDLLDESVGK